METEVFLSGYCRELDGSRTVLLEAEAGKFTADCSYGGCPYENSCPIAERIEEIRKENPVI